MEGVILNAINHVQNISKKQGTFARINSIMKKADKNLTGNELDNLVGNMVDKTIIEYHQHNKSYTVPDFTDDTILAEHTQDTDEDATQTPSQEKENYIEDTQHERYQVIHKDISETCDIATKFKLFQEFQVSLEKKLLELEAAKVSGCYGQTPPQNNTSGNSLTSLSIMNILKDSISFLGNELCKKNTIIDFP